jgi:multisubunit Na+/H+ antiporter MnhE subunit
MCLGVWLITLSAVSMEDLVVATLVSFPCGVLAVVGRVATRHTWGLRPVWLVPLLTLPIAIVSDTFQVLSSAVLRRPGRFDSIAVGGGVGDGARAQGRRAIASFWVTVTPGSLVADIDPGTGEALIHVLAERGPRMQRLATR